jgi:hypothetical protein
MKRSRWILLCILAAGCSSSNNQPNSPSEPECGIERWHVKILTDAASSNIDWTPVATTIAQQNAFPQLIVSEDTTRMAFEEQAVSMACTIVEFKKEDDRDIHLVLVDTAQDSMIAEIPGTSCAEVAASSHAAGFDAAAKWISDHLGTPDTYFKHVNVSATITGVLFQDFAHGQEGHAKNYREIHPVTNIQ